MAGHCQVGKEPAGGLLAGLEWLPPRANVLRKVLDSCRRWACARCPLRRCVGSAVVSANEPGGQLWDVKVPGHILKVQDGHKQGVMREKNVAVGLCHPRGAAHLPWGFSAPLWA